MTISNIFKDYTSDEKYQLFEELLSEDTEQMFVTPKDIDEIVDNLSKIIASGINMFCNVLKQKLIIQDLVSYNFKSGTKGDRKSAETYKTWNNKTV